MRKYYIALTIILIISVLAIVLNISVSQGPVQDNASVKDIESIDTAVQSYATKHRALPANLDAVDLSDDLKSRAASYEYKKGNNGKYQLCATYKTDTTKTGSAALLGSSSSANDGNPSVHAKGKVCTDYTAYSLSYSSSSYSSSSSSNLSSLYNSSSANKVCSTTVSSSSEEDYGTISKVDTKAGTVTTDTGTYHWSLPPSAALVYDVNCKATTVAALKVDSDVDIYHSSAGLIQVMQLQ